LVLKEFLRTRTRINITAEIYGKLPKTKLQKTNPNPTLNPNPKHLTLNPSPK